MKFLSIHEVSSSILGLEKIKLIQYLNILMDQLQQQFVLWTIKASTFAKWEKEQIQVESGWCSWLILRSHSNDTTRKIGSTLRNASSSYLITPPFIWMTGSICSLKREDTWHLLYPNTLHGLIQSNWCSTWWRNVFKHAIWLNGFSSM